MEEKRPRVPPGQIVTKIFPVLSATEPPEIDIKEFKFRVFGAVKNPYFMSWEELMQMPKIKRTLDVNCVTHWSRLDDVWEGISLKAVLEKANPVGKYTMHWAN